MSNLLEYKGYYGTVEYSDEDKVLCGKVIGIRAMIDYEGTSVDELTADFHSAIDDYLELCRAENIEPEKTYRGTFNVRISPELHRDLAVTAAAHGRSLNAAVEDAIREYIHASAN